MRCLDFILRQHKKFHAAVGEGVDEVDAFVHPEMNGKNAFHILAAKTPGSETIEKLEKYNDFLKNLNIFNRPEDSNEATPLLIAVKWNNNEIAKYLIQNDVDFTTRDKNGQSPINIAVREGQEVIVREMLSHGKEENFECLFTTL